MNKDEQERATLHSMIKIYCRAHHKDLRTESGCTKNDLCPECETLFSYAQEKVDRCPRKEERVFCSNCTIHCYKPEMREQIRVVMRYSGPRMIWHNPIMAVKHLISTGNEK